MFDIGWPELVVIMVVALVVIGPKDLPKVLYTVGKWVRKARALTRDFQNSLDDMMREAEIEDLKKQALTARDFNIQKAVEDTVDPTGSLKQAFEPPQLPGLSGTPGSALHGDGAGGNSTAGPASGEPGGGGPVGVMGEPKPTAPAGASAAPAPDKRV